MDLVRPSKYQDVLIKMHTGAWFGFYKDADISTGIGATHEYENLVIIPVDGVTHDKPTKDYLDTELAKLQAEWDDFAYGRNRRNGYPTIGDQLDMIYHDQVNSTTTFKDAVKAVKDKYPKG
tara:strand:+ start:1164 stop:1526 length:363 start_codon:yes stop_codon:yes gene_type:complete